MSLDLWGEAIIEDLVEEKEKLPSLFDCLNSLRDHKDIRNVDPELRSFESYMINKALMQDVNTVQLANMVNCTMPKDVHYLFLLNTIPKGRSYAKWAKVAVDKQYETLIEFGYGERQAKDMLYVFTDEQMKLFIKDLKSRKNK